MHRNKKPKKVPPRKNDKADWTAYMKEVDKVARKSVNAVLNPVAKMSVIFDAVAKAADDLARIPGFGKYMQMLDRVADRLFDHILRVKEIEKEDAAS